MIVVDTNVIAYMIVNGPNTQLAEGVRLKDPDWTAPSLWRSECRNVLLQYVKRNEIELESAIELMEAAEQLVGEIEYRISSKRVLELANSSGCTAYDCEFVALAEYHGIELITSDRKVLTAFPMIAISIEAFAS